MAFCKFAAPLSVRSKADEFDRVPCCPFEWEDSTTEVDNECFDREIGLSFLASRGDLTCFGDSGSGVKDGNDVRPFGELGEVERAVSVWRCLLDELDDDFRGLPPLGRPKLSLEASIWRLRWVLLSNAIGDALCLCLVTLGMGYESNASFSAREFAREPGLGL